MSYSRVTKIGDGVSTQFSVNFALGYVDTAHITARVGTEVDGVGAPVYRAITFITSSLLQISGAPAGIGVNVLFERTVPKTSLLVNFSNGDVMDEINLDTSQKQQMHAVHEVIDGRLSTMTQDLDMGGFKIINVADPTTAQGAATKNYVDQRIADLGEFADDISAVAGDITKVVIVADNIADVIEVANNMPDVNTVAGISDQIAAIGVEVAEDQEAAAASAASAADSAAQAAASVASVTPTVRRFSGDGSTVSFDLATGAINENLTNVYVSGVYQRKDTYDVNDGVLVFSAAPATGSNNIEVVVSGSTAMFVVGNFATQAIAIAATNASRAMSALNVRQAIEGGSFQIGAGSWPIQYRFGGNSSSSPMALQIGGGYALEGPDGVTLGNDGHSSWLRFQPSKDESAVELVVYPTGAQGRATCVAGTNTIMRVDGTLFKAAWVGRKVYIIEQWYRIATVPDANTMTVTNGSANVPFSNTITDTFHVIVIRGTGQCNITGTTVTRVSGDPFVPFISSPFKIVINGVQRTVSSFNSVDSYTLSSAPGDATNVSYVWETDINDQIVAFRLQKMLGSDEENLSIFGRYDGYWIHSLFAGNGKYRKIVLGSGEMSAGTLARQLVLQKNGDLSIMGDYGYDAVRVLNPTGISVVNRLETQGSPTGFAVGWRARGADTNVGLAFDTQGTGPVTFTCGQFNGVNLQIFGTVGATSWLAVAGSTSDTPSLVAAGSATNADIWMIPKGTGGRMRFGTFTSQSDLPVVGTIEIKDSGGTIRRVAIV